MSTPHKNSHIVESLTQIIISTIILTDVFGCTRAIFFNKESIRDGSQTENVANLLDSASPDLKLVGDSIKIDVLKNADATRDINILTDLLHIDGAVIPGNWIAISAGAFKMGSPSGEACRSTFEPQHSVTLTHPFEISATEVTQQQFFSVRGYQPSAFKSCGNNCPVESLNWYEAAAYCNALSANKGYSKCYDCGGSGSNVTCTQNATYLNGEIYHCPGYRLPTAAEWEYAYRAGTTTSFYNDTNIINCSSSDVNANIIGWNSSNSGSTPHPVGLKPANKWGLYDMAGNVSEWNNDWGESFGSAAVTDPYGGTSGGKYVRGGGWDCIPDWMRAAFYTSYGPTNRFGNLGFRCVRSK